MPWGFNLSGSGAGEPERVRAAVVTTNLFAALNLVPAAGRMLTNADNNSSDRFRSHSHLGTQVSTHRSKSVDEFVGREFDYMITICNKAMEYL